MIYRFIAAVWVIASIVYASFGDQFLDAMKRDLSLLGDASFLPGIGWIYGILSGLKVAYLAYGAYIFISSVGSDTQKRTALYILFPGAIELFARSLR